MELPERQKYLLDGLVRHHHGFLAAEVESWVTKSWDECRGFIQKKLTQNCDKIFRDWFQYCDQLADALRAGKTCYYIKQGATHYFDNYLELFLSAKYGGAGDTYLVVLTDEDIGKFKKLPPGGNFCRFAAGTSKGA